MFLCLSACFDFTCFLLGRWGLIGHFLVAQLVKKSAIHAVDPRSIPGSGRSAGEGIGYPLQNFSDSLVAQLVKNLPAMWDTWIWPLGWEDPWRREQLPTPVFWPGEFHGLYSPWDRKELDMTEWLSLSQSLHTGSLQGKAPTSQLAGDSRIS